MSELDLNIYLSELEKYYFILDNMHDFVNDKSPPDAELSIEYIIRLKNEILREIGFRTICPGEFEEENERDY